MEQWEIDERKRLQEKLPDGAYDLSTPGCGMITGKGGFIEFQIALLKEIRKPIKESDMYQIYKNFLENEGRAFKNDNNDKSGEL